MVNIVIKRSHLPNKKYDAVIDDKKTVPFGAKNYSDYTIHKDPARKERYINRHKAREDWNDYRTPGFYSRWILWNMPTLRESVADTVKRFPSLKIKVQV